jgi:carbamoyltransferase
MNILGIHPGHDAALALVSNGKLVSALSVERYSRVKKDNRITREFLDWFLGNNNMTLDDIDKISMSFYQKMNIDFLSIYSPSDMEYPISTFSSLRKNVSILNHLDSFENKPEYVEGLGYSLPDELSRIDESNSSNWLDLMDFEINCKIDGYDRIIPGLFIDHHITHAASAFYTSPFEHSSIFSVDASMMHHKACSLFSLGYGHRLQRFRFPGYTLGNMYSVITEFSGLGPGLTKAGTMMGLSSFGDVSKVAVDNWKDWSLPQWKRDIPDDYLFIEWVFSQLTNRYPYVGYYRTDVAENQPGSWYYSRPYQEPYTKDESTSKEVMDLAANVQYITENSLVEYAQTLYNETHKFNGDNLCLSGGTMLNCNANYKIKTQTDFKNIHFFPACGDDGSTVGAALYVAHQYYGLPRVEYTNSDIAYLGPNYIHYPATNRRPRNLDMDFIAKSISEGKIICWYQGRSEFGPRALGNRSFISDPRRAEMKDILNSRVKFREWFRPFAPIVLNEYKEEWFDMDFESPFMLYTVPCKKPTEIPSAVHIDNTSRVQTLNREDNEMMYDLIDKFREITGVPVVLNTSLNVKGQPIVETPEDAMKLFDESDVDILVINNKMYFK